MNAFTTTAEDLALAISGKPRADQSVYVSRSVYGGSLLGARHIVLVIPAGSTTGEYYECGDRSLALLRAGMTPEYLELEPVEEDAEI